MEFKTDSSAGRYEHFHIDPFPHEGGFRDRVTVSKVNPVGAGWEPAQVSWSSIGNVTPDQAALFGEALIIAAHKARELDRQYPSE